MVATADRCLRCHKPDGLVPPIEAGRISKPADWLAMHVADPQVIAAGIREAPQGSPTEQAENRAMMAALARLRSGTPPAVDAETLHVYVLFSRFCFNCHVMDGTGGKDGPELSRAGLKLSAATIEQRITDPVSLDPNAEMPSFMDKISPEDIKKLAAWLAQRK